jgi:hypothetical protein
MRGSNLLPIWPLLAVIPCACTSPHDLDGPIELIGTRGSVDFGEHLILALDGDATYSVHQLVLGGPGMYAGTVPTDQLVALYDDLGAVDLASFHSTYSCQDLPCSGIDGTHETAIFHTDSGTRQIQIDRNIPDDELPPRLIKIFNDLDGVISELQEAAPMTAR